MTPFDHLETVVPNCSGLGLGRGQPHTNESRVCATRGRWEIEPDLTPLPVVHQGDFDVDGLEDGGLGLSGWIGVIELVEAEPEKGAPGTDPLSP